MVEMNKLCKFAMVLVLIASTIAGCNKKEVDSAPSPAKEAKYNRYQPEVHFLVGNDGQRYTEDVSDVGVGEVFFLRIQVRVKTNPITSFFRQFGQELNNIDVKVTISKTEIVDAYLAGATTPVTLQTDPFNNTRYCPFQVVASTNPEITVVVLRCRAIEAGTQMLEVTFGEQVNSRHSAMQTITYIEKTQD
jgi:hypothetical protein